MKKINTIPAFAIAFVLGLAGPAVALAATTPSLGDAATYAVLSDTYTNPLGPTTLTGDVGFTTGPVVAPLGIHANYGSGAPYATAGTAQATALTNLNGQVCDFTFAAPAVVLDTTLEHSPTYGPGVYCSTGAMSIGTAGGITLSGAGTYIFRSGGALNAVTGSTVNLSPGASACDVFWTPNGATTLNANATFVGTVIPNVAWDITVLDTVSWVGRALAFGQTVTTSNTNAIVTVPTCALPPASSTSTGGTGSNYWILLPLIDVTKTAYPSVLPEGPGSVTYTYVVTNVGKSALNTVWVTDDKCSPAQYISGDSNSDGFLDLTETWTYTCTKVVSQTETNTATAHGYANSTDVYDTAVATVAVSFPTPTPIVTTVVGQVLGTSTPSFPNAGLPSRETSPWTVLMALSILIVASISLAGALKKRTD
jgi:hypothetical protein